MWTADHWARRRDPAKLLVMVQVEGTPQTAIVGSGCSQTLSRAELVKPPDPAGKPIYMQCIFGDIRLYPTARVRLLIGGHEAECRVGLIRALAYPVVLGWDWPWFQEILRDCSHSRREEETLVPTQKELLCKEQQDDLGEWLSK